MVARSRQCNCRRQGGTVAALKVPAQAAWGLNVPCRRHASSWEGVYSPPALLRQFHCRGAPSAHPGSVRLRLAPSTLADPAALVAPAVRAEARQPRRARRRHQQRAAGDDGPLFCEAAVVRLHGDTPLPAAAQAFVAAVRARARALRLLAP